MKYHRINNIPFTSIAKIFTRQSVAIKHVTPSNEEPAALDPGTSNQFPCVSSTQSRTSRANQRRSQAAAPDQRTRTQCISTIRKPI